MVNKAFPAHKLIEIFSIHPAIVALDRQLQVPHSERLSLTLTHPSVVLAQQYLALSPKCEDILSGWKKAQEVSDSIITSLVMSSHSLFQSLLDAQGQKHFVGGGLDAFTHNVGQVAITYPILSSFTSKPGG